MKPQIANTQVTPEPLIDAAIPVAATGITLAILMTFIMIAAPVAMMAA